MIHPPDLVLFDCDGVLVDSERLTNAIIRDNLAGHGLDLRLDEVIDLFVGGTMPGVRDAAIRLGARLPNDWLDAIYAEMFARLADEVEAVPGVEAVLDQLDAAGIPFAVGSNGPHAKMAVTLRRTGLDRRLQGRIWSREDVPRPKPAPDIYLHAAASLNVPPARSVVVEDSASGARAGRAAGMRVLGFTRDTEPARLAPHCDALFADMSELPRLLGL